ncbi:MAG: VWA domain-containing protein, partial [Rhodobacterales bacterium]|nr:VWA domain-containing protein [Rhodobacterales bacterium]
LLTFKPDVNDSGSDQYIDNIGNSTSVGEQSASYAQFDYSVNDGTTWSASSATMTIDVNAVADAPILIVEASTVLTETITVDNVNNTGYGYSVTAYNADGSVGNISTHTTTPTGFGVAGDVAGGSARGDVTEISYDTALSASEQIVVNFDQDVNSVDVSVAWNAASEDIAVAFYKDGVLIETINTGGGSDAIDDLGTLQPSGGGMFDEIRFYPPDADDDFLIHSISFNREVVSNNLSVSEGEDVALDITSSLIDTDGSETLTLAITDVPAGATLSDGTHTFTADAITTSVDITNWNLTNITFNMPSVASGSMQYTLNVVATATEYSNGDSASRTAPVTITVNDVNYVNLQDNTASVDEAAMSSGTNSASTAEVATGNILSDDQIGSNFSLSDVSISGGTTVDTGTNYKVTTAEGNVLVVDKATGDYTYTLVNPITHATGSDTAIDSFTYTVSDGSTDYQANLDVTIHDDAPISTPSTVELYVEPITTNVIFVLDVSGSMDNTELGLQEDARDEVISKYQTLGNVNAMQVQFEATVYDNTGWTDANNIKGTSLYTNGGKTNYEDALNSVMNTYDTNRPEADQTIIYFLSDGAITVGSTTNWNSAWESFIGQDSITKLFTIGVGGMSDDLDAVALPTETEKSPDPIPVDDINDLGTVLSQTAQLYAEGSLTEVINGTALIDFGADGGHIGSITIGSLPAVAYDAANPVQTINGEYGTFEINFNTGAYRYNPATQDSVTETMSATVVDNDGDSINTQILTINVNLSGELTGGPIITPTDLSVAKDVAQVIATVIDANGTVVSSSGTANNGTVTIDASGNITYTPTAGYTGEDKVTITATDNDGITSVRTLIVGVNPGDAQAATLIMTLGSEENAYVEISDNFDTSLGAWTLSSGYLDNGTMRIDGGGDTATNTTAYNFGAENANKTATISFSTIIDGNWYSHSSDVNDDIFVQVFENGNWVTKADIYRDNLDGVTQTINNVVLDANGEVDIRIVNSSSQNNEDIWIDNFSVSVANGYKYDLNLAAVLADGNETLSDVTLTNMPDNITLKDSNGVEIAQNPDGSYSVALDSNGNSTVSIYSDTQLDPTQTTPITATVTSTDGTDTATTTLGGSGDETVVYESG